MELTGDLISIQTILKHASKTIGDFTKINYKGGNEMKISLITTNLQAFLTSKNYLKQGKIEKEFLKEVKNITYFLILNTKFNANITPSIKEHLHLINACPLLSKCLLANLVIELDLVTCCCNVLEELPLVFLKEILYEIEPCLKKSAPKTTLEYTDCCLREIILKISNANPMEEQNETHIDDLNEIARNMLFVLLKVDIEKMQGQTKKKIYQHMGYTLLNLLKLLQMCNIDNISSKLIFNLANTTTEVLKAVTINVYCTWAEIQYEGEVLQTVIQGQAYYVMQKYQGFDKTKELLQMLSSMARKPKTLSELIRESDVDAMVQHIDNADKNQRIWFTALLQTQVFRESKAISCLDRWSHLCVVEDVCRILNLAAHTSNPDANEIIIKCFNHLTCEDTLLILVRFSYQNKFKYTLETKHMKTKYKLILNTIHTEGSDFVKELVILCVQNIHYVLRNLFAECIRRSSYSPCLKPFFTSIKQLLEIDNIGINILISVIQLNISDIQNNICNFKELIITLLEIKAFNSLQIISKLFEPMLKKFDEDMDYENLKKILYLMNAVSEMCLANVDVTCGEIYKFIKFIFQIFDMHRINFFECTSLNQNITEEIVAFLNHYIKVLSNGSRHFEDTQPLNATHFINKYYISCVVNGKSLPFNDYILPNSNCEEYFESVDKLLKLLPSCVTYEWKDVESGLVLQNGHVKTVLLLSDVVILLCQLVNSQEDSGECNYSLAGLKYCLLNYGIIIKSKLKISITMEEEIQIIKKVCKIICEIPKCIKEEEGLKLVMLFPESTLKILKEDKQFAILLVTMENIKISQLIARKILSV